MAGISAAGCIAVADPIGYLAFAACKPDSSVSDRADDSGAVKMKGYL